MATPPTKVACWMSSTRIPLPWMAVTMKAAMVLPVSEQYVLVRMMVLSKVLLPNSPKLKKGHKTHRNMVPINPVKFEE